MNSIKERLIRFINHLGISVRQFEVNCGLSNSLVNNIGDTIRNTTVEKISKYYPELNILWLQTGYGEMLYDPKALEVINEVRESSPSYRKTPLTSTDNENSLIAIIEDLRETLKTQQETIKSQQETIKIQSETIRKLISK